MTTNCPWCEGLFEIETPASFWEDTQKSPIICPFCGYTWEIGTNDDPGYIKTLPEVSEQDK